MRVNDKIRAREVRVIDGASGKQIGIMRTEEALRLARSQGLDLIEVAPQATPPVCRILNFGKYRYELAKQEKDRKHNPANKVKEIKFRVNIDQHDYLTKIRRAEEFLDRGHKVKVVLQFRGRENMHQELGFDLINRVKNDLATMGHADVEPKLVGRAINMMLSPLPQQKRHRKFAPLKDHEIEDLDSEDDAPDSSDA